MLTNICSLGTRWTGSHASPQLCGFLCLTKREGSSFNDTVYSLLTIHLFITIRTFHVSLLTFHSNLPYLNIYLPNNLILFNGQKRTTARPINLSSGKKPHQRPSKEFPRLSPIIKYECSGIITGPQIISSVQGLS